MTTNPAPSNALISFQSGGSGDSGFSTSGQVDWVTIAGSSVKFTVDVLARLSKAGIEAFTLAAAYALLAPFKLSNRAEVQVYESVGKLRAFSSFNSALYFGFGVKHIVRSLADSAEGLSILSLCAILADFYGIEHAGLVLRELFKLLNPPTDLTPTLAQWRNITKACAGAISHSTFKHHLAGISRLYYGITGDQSQYPKGNEVQIAAALHGLSEIASGKTSEAVFVGGTDCALIAAVASWLLDLNVEVREEDQQQILFKHTSTIKRKGPGGYFVAVVFTRVNAPDLSSQGQMATKTSEYRRVFRVQQLFTLSSKDIPISAEVCTRLNWSDLLEEVFGESLEEVLSGVYAERAGCLFTTLTLYHLLVSTFPNSKVGEPFEPRPTFWDYKHAASYGSGLLLTVEKGFPEISGTAFLRSATKKLKDTIKLASDDYCSKFIPNCSERDGLLGLLAESFRDIVYEDDEESVVIPCLRFVWFLYHVSRCFSVFEVDESNITLQTWCTISISKRAWYFRRINRNHRPGYWLAEAVLLAFNSAPPFN
ncbi:hypothetical protein TWF718_005871 [Orbilia javanica]|uniref:Uncharacterized protein n=1 Tax=Orbilia javanica TaxID=47235 RepID=A0AAN8MZM1_9PEZI